MEKQQLIDQLRKDRAYQSHFDQKSINTVAGISSGIEKVRYTIYNSELNGQGRDSFNTFFSNLLDGVYSGPNYSMLEIHHMYSPEVAEHGLKDEIQRILAGKRGKAIGLEIGGPGSHLFSEFDTGFFDSTYGACLNDLRSDVDIAQDRANGHRVVDSINAFTEEGIELIRKSLPGGKADLLIERMGGPLFGSESELSVYPNNMFSLLRIAQGWYSLLQEGGVMYAQIPPELFLIMRDSHYTEWIQKRFGDVLDIKVENHKLAKMRVYALKLVKKPGAPEQLPLVGIIDYLHAASGDDRADKGIVGKVFTLKMAPEDRKELLAALKADPTEMFRSDLFFDMRLQDQDKKQDKIFQAKRSLFALVRLCVEELRQPTAQEIEKIKDELGKVIRFTGQKRLLKDPLYNTEQVQTLQVLEEHMEDLIPLYIDVMRGK